MPGWANGQPRAHRKRKASRSGDRLSVWRGIGRNLSAASQVLGWSALVPATRPVLRATDESVPAHFVICPKPFSDLAF